MPLTCECGDGDWFHEPPEDFAPMPMSVRRKRCVSCGELIEPGSDAGRFYCWHHPKDGIELNICGGDEAVQIYTADQFMCGNCTGLYFSLADLGFCPDLGEDMRGLVKEYAAVYGRKAAHRKRG